jgi:hypothetical protein
MLGPDFRGPVVTAETTCGAPTAAGSPCRRRTGGGRCRQHHDVAEVVALAGERFRRQVLKVYELTGPELELLDQAAATLDAIVDLDARVTSDGLMIAGSAGQMVLHPAVGEARQQRAAFARLLAQLALPDVDGGGETIRTPEAVRAQRAAQARWRRAAEQRRGS